MFVLITGGAGYIGSHICVEFLKAGHEIVLFDNFINSDYSVDRVAFLHGGDRLVFIKNMVEKK